jgi:hypothetical protein
MVVRTSPDGKTIGEPHLCAKPGRIARVPGILTLEEQIAILLSDGESVDEGDASGRRKILAGNKLAGFIEVMTIVFRAHLEFATRECDAD